MCLGQSQPSFAAPPPVAARAVAPPPGTLRPATSGDTPGSRAGGAAAPAGRPLLGQSEDVSLTAPLQARDTFGRTPRERVATTLRDRGKLTPDQESRRQLLQSVRFGGSFLEPRF